MQLSGSSSLYSTQIELPRKRQTSVRHRAAVARAEGGAGVLFGGFGLTGSSLLSVPNHSALSLRGSGT